MVKASTTLKLGTRKAPVYAAVVKRRVCTTYRGRNQVVEPQCLDGAMAEQWTENTIPSSVGISRNTGVATGNRDMADAKPTMSRSCTE